MRKVTKLTVNAFLNKQNLIVSNTEARYNKYENFSYLYLFGNCIAELNHATNEMKISNCGWQSNTTKERLNSLPNVSIQQKNFTWFLNGIKWDGTSKLIKI